jgi:phosphonate transport system substrate-binding protein
VTATADGQTVIAGGQLADPGTVARLEAAGISQTALQVVWTSGLLRYGPHAVRSDLDREAKRRLVVFLTNLRSMSPEVYDLLESKHSGGFIVADPKEYAMATAIVRLVSGNSSRH